MLSRLFKPRPAKAAGEALYAAAARQARSPRFYAEMGVPDTREGRFEMYSLHVVLLLDRLKGQGPQADETAQILIETYIRGLDDAFREMGVGDTAVAKRV
ncbi:MAG: ubiquinol-cytochrome C chaperone family protein, partial [Pseudomonadota bacterium]